MGRTIRLLANFVWQTTWRTVICALILGALYPLVAFTLLESNDGTFSVSKLVATLSDPSWLGRYLGLPALIGALVGAVFGVALGIINGLVLGIVTRVFFFPVMPDKLTLYLRVIGIGAFLLTLAVGIVLAVAIILERPDRSFPSGVQVTVSYPFLIAAPCLGIIMRRVGKRFAVRQWPVTPQAPSSV